MGDVVELTGAVRSHPGLLPVLGIDWLKWVLCKCLGNKHLAVKLSENGLRTSTF